MQDPGLQFPRTSGLPPHPARDPAPQRRSPWRAGLWVLLVVTVVGALAGPVVGTLAYDLARLNPLVLLLGLVVGGTYGLAAGVVLGALTTAVVALRGASSPDGRR